VGESVHTIKKDKEALLVATNETGLEVNAVTTKYKFMFCEQKQSKIITYT